MEPRKLIRLGNSSFAIALPKDWIDKSGLKKGDDVFIEKNSNGEIIVSSEFKKGEDKQIEIALDKVDNDLLKKHLHAAYIKGYNTVKVKGNSKETKMLKELLGDYISFELMDSNGEEILIKDFFDIKEIKFENLVKRIDTNLKEMFEIIKRDVESGKLTTKTLKEIEEIDKEVNKFYFLCSRVFMKGVDNPTVLNILKMNGGELFNSWWIAFHLESLGDGLKYVARWINKSESFDRGAISDFISKLHKEYSKSMESFYSRDSKKALEVIQNTKMLKNDLEKLEKDPKNLKLTAALDLIEKNVYQNAKMVFHMRY